MADLAALLDKEASAEIEAIVAEARERASAIVAEAEREADALKAARERQARNLRQATLVRARSAAQLEAASTRLNAQQAAIAAVFEAVEADLDAVARDAAAFTPLATKLLAEALEAMGGDADAILAHDDDVAVVQAAANAVGVASGVTGDSTVARGCLRVRKGRMVIENGLATRLDALREELASEVAAKLSSAEA